MSEPVRIEPAPAEMTAVIVSAGRGSRLLPLTQAIPKCLVQVGGRAILDHQLDALADAGVRHAVVVAGYRADQVADHLARAPHAIAVRLIFNPFWAVASSIASVWAAHDAVTRPFCLMNGDTVFDAAVIAGALADARPGVNLVVERPVAFEIDDMRVRTDGDRVTAVAKTLGDDATHRSLGLVVSRDADGGGYAAALHQTIAAEHGLQAYHHNVVARLANGPGVHAIVARGGWQEIDRPQDIAAWRSGHPDGGLGAVA
ncbi:MAG: phosphocholine cytidylyltransferase family protein [Pseudomonadota bacterium]